jgi:hypothetical protein
MSTQHDSEQQQDDTSDSDMTRREYLGATGLTVLSLSIGDDEDDSSFYDDWFGDEEDEAGLRLLDDGETIIEDATVDTEVSFEDGLTLEELDSGAFALKVAGVGDGIGAFVDDDDDGVAELQKDHADFGGGDARNIGTADAQAVNADEQHIGDVDLWVTPETHDFDDIVSELNDGKSVYAMAGDYPGDDTQKTITDGSLHMADGAQIVVPDDPPGRWIDLIGSTGSPADITADVSEGDTEITVEDTSGFESGKPALISDDAGYLTMGGRGECVLVGQVLDGTTLEIRNEVEFDHLTSDTISIEPMDPLTEEHSWVNVTFDCRGSDQSGGDHPLIYRRFVDNHAFDRVRFVNGDGSSMHQYLEDRDSWHPRVINSVSGRVDDGDLGLFYSPEQRTTNAKVRDCVVHHGQVCQFGNNANGPSIDPEFVGVTSYGESFPVTDTAIRATFNDCTVYHAQSSYNSGAGGFKNNAYRTKYIDCTVIGAVTVGFQLNGTGEKLEGCDTIGVSEPIKCESSVSARSDAGEEPIIVEDGTFRDFDILVNCRDSLDGIELSDCTMTTTDGVWLGGSTPPDSVTIDGGYMESAAAGSFGISKLTVRGLEYNGKGLKFLRETSSTVNGELVFSDCEFYNIDGNEAIRVSNYDLLYVSECRVPTTETQIKYWLVREEGGSGDLNLVLRGNDSRNTGAPNGTGIDYTTSPISDGTNLAQDGTTF